MGSGDTEAQERNNGNHGSNSDYSYSVLGAIG